jgi:POT family proton-dependent oligopeptide transporter
VPSALSVDYGYEARTSQPKGLFILFFSEMWERFSYYGMRALLVLYMTKQLMFSDAKAYGIYGAYGAMVYGASIIGGYIADHFTGSRYAVFLGGIIIAIGHFAMALPPFFSALPHEEILFIALAFIVVGTGFFKGNIAALVGQLYQANDPRRDSGYTLFYMGINIGAFLAPLACGYVGEKIGWHYGFSLAGFGMTAGLLIVYWGRQYLEDAGKTPILNEAKTSLPFDKKKMNALILVGSLLSIPLFTYVIRHSELSGYILNLFGILSVVLIIYFAFRSPLEERKCLLTLLVMFPFVMSFFACFEQCGSSMNLFADRHVNRTFLGYELPTSWLQSVNPMFIVLLAPFVAKLWTWLGKRGMDPLTPTKFSLGLLQAGLGFGALLIAIRGANADGMVSMWWLVLAYLLHTTGELCLSPVGLSMVSKISPPRFVGFMMGCFYLAIAFSHLIAAGVAKIASLPEECSVEVDRIASLKGFYHAFEVLFYFPVAAGIVMFLIAPLLKGIFERHQ